MRLGRDGAVEEWLATDTSLDRPVLIRQLGPESTAAARAAFLQTVRDLAQVRHEHLSAVFAAAANGDSVYAVMEWTGGMTIADRVAADALMPVDEFLPNAAGLASALAAAHARGAVHGSISPAAVTFSAAHPAKLGRFGSGRTGVRAVDDVRALAQVLGLAVTGRDEAAPAQLTEGLDPAIDDALRAAARGDLDAAGLAAALREAPSPPAPSSREWSWRWLIGAAALAGIIVVAAVAARVIGSEGSDPFTLPPAASPPLPPDPPVTTTLMSTPPAPLPSPPVTLVRTAVYDPLGDGEEFDRLLPSLGDEDTSTAWRTERYFAELGLIKDGVGVLFELEGQPTRVEVAASVDTAYRLRWAEAVPADPTGWQDVAVGRAPLDLGHDLPPRDGGVWLLWLTELTPRPTEEQVFYYSEIGEVRWSP